ncbi:MAG TPA: PKD domain-containing protein, partial [Thermoplasmata archaeon]|nr:PKD domain-containing protein [Thermoplasmata archaeon]
DLSPPSVAASAAPSLQDIFAPVAITATVTDNDGVSGVTAEVRDPYGATAAVPMALSGGVWRGTYVPSDLGIHGITVWAADLSGNLGQGGTAFLSVDRQAPTITANAPSIAEVLSTVDLTASVADNLGSFVATLEVRAPTGASLGNRTLFGPPPFLISQRVGSLGLFTWTVYAVDPSGNAARATGTIQVVDSQPPLADAGPDRTVLEGTIVALDGSGSTDNYGIASHTWTFSANGAPQVLQGARVAFAFHLAGAYTVRLIVTDLSGKTGEDTATITVAPLDTDADGLPDRDEATAGTDPSVRDTDDDGILDGSDPDPLTAAFDIGRLLGSWFIVLLLFTVFLIILALGFRRRGKGKTSASPPPVARIVARATRPRRPLPPPPTD